MLEQILLSASVLATPLDQIQIDYDASSMVHGYEMRLSQDERDRIYQEIHFAVKKMNYYLKKADSEASKIKDVSIRDATVGAIEGAIAGLSGRTPYAVVIGGCLGALGHIAGNGYYHFSRSRDYLREAESFAYIADELQERLWRDE